MSQFDHPRINFFGEASINPPTANNNSLLPLVLFDPVKVKAVIPPRIYFSKELQHLHSIGLLTLPEGTSLSTDEDGLKYLGISTVNTAGIFKDWVTAPLGQSQADKQFHTLYKYISTVKDKQPLHGLVPAGWNYYGGMEFKFEQARVCSVEVVENQEAVCYTNSDENIPPGVGDLMNASVDLTGEKGRNTGVMVDVIPNLAFYTQVFCDALTVRNNHKILLRGKPCKASLRFLNINRVVDQNGSIAGSGTFYCTIPLHAVAGTDNAPLIKFFLNYKTQAAEITGVFIRYDLFEVKENRQINYSEAGTRANPARCSVLGSITPCYRTDMRSIAMGRQMIPVRPFYRNITLPPFVCRFLEERKVLSLDLIGLVPEISDEEAPDEPYHTYDLGELKISIQAGDNTGIYIGSLIVNEKNMSRRQFINTGGIFEISYAHNTMIDEKIINEGMLILSLLSKEKEDGKTEHEILMKESEFMVASDQSGIYINQDDDPEEGYVSYSHCKEPCLVNIFRRGRPLEAGVPMTVVELKIKSLFGESTRIFLETKDFRNNQSLHFPATEAAVVIYVFYPGGTYNGSANLLPDMLASGFFINLHILPKHDYGKYFDHEHPDHQSQVSFEVLYNEVLKVYDLIYPSSSLITPFTEQYFKGGWMFIKQRLAPGNWTSFSYMPSSRDMSLDQWRLFCKWAETVT